MANLDDPQNPSMHEALKSYALRVEWAAVSKFHKFCEDTADAVTKLLVIMERYRCEDGDVSCRGSTFSDASNALFSSLNRIRDHLSISSPFVQHVLGKWHVLILEKIVQLMTIRAAALKESTDKIPSSEMFRSLRRILWDAADELATYARTDELAKGMRRGDRGTKIDYATWKLMGHTDVSLKHLATALVDHDLDRIQRGSHAKRVNREEDRIREVHRRSGMVPFPDDT